MPSNAIYVGRPTKWGNPFSLKDYSLKESLVHYRTWLRQCLRNNVNFLGPLRGKDLACWCPLDQPCHADILLGALRDVEAFIA